MPKALRRLPLALAAIALLALACGGPFVMIPGGELSGTVEPAPSDWSFSDSVDDVQLETRPDDPYSVNVWGVADGDRFLIASGRGMESAWARHIVDDPRVRLRIEGRLFELEARRSDAPEDVDTFLEAARRKYDFEPDPDQRDEAVLFVLTRR